MSVARFIAIMFILGAISAAWMILGGSIWFRTHEMDQQFSAEMASQWGPEVVAQQAPYWAPTRAARRTEAEVVSPASSVITAHIANDHRYKGLLWYSTFTVKFRGRYGVPAAKSPAAQGGGFLIFPLPREVTGYDALTVTVDGTEVDIPHADISAGRIAVPVDSKAEHAIEVAYTMQGQNVWLYCPGEVPARNDGWESGTALAAGGPLAELNDFSLTVTTDFADIDFPAASPTAPAAPAGKGKQAKWTYDKATTNQVIGVTVPKHPNAGPLAARMSFFAPVSLLMFFTVLFTTVVLKRIPLHPMHYLFIATGFFAFHILLAYLADVVNIHAAFWICSGVSVFLVVTYMRLVAGVKFAVVFVGLAQLVYLVGFSYAFFWRGRTGLTVTIVAIVTLFCLMQATGRVNWFDVFKPKPRAQAAPRATGPPPLK